MNSSDLGAFKNILNDTILEKLVQKMVRSKKYPQLHTKFGQMVHFMVWRVIMIEGNRTGVRSVGVLWVLFHSSWTMNGTFEEHLLKKYLKGGYSTLGFWDNGKQSSWFRTKLPYFRDIYPLYWFCLFIYWSFLGRIISTQIRQVKSFTDFNGAVPRVQN